MTISYKAYHFGCICMINTQFIFPTNILNFQTEKYFVKFRQLLPKKCQSSYKKEKIFKSARRINAW